MNRRVVENPVLTGLNNGWGGIIDDSYFWNFKMLRTFLKKYIFRTFLWSP
jgi:hypothetical protein